MRSLATKAAPRRVCDLRPDEVSAIQRQRFLAYTITGALAIFATVMLGLSSLRLQREWK